MNDKYAVLFVDDEDNILNALRRGLADEDYACLFANSAANALKILEDKHVSVIVSDMRMPDMDGLALLKKVKEKYPKVVRMVFSGYSQLQQVIATINQAEVFKFLTKPWNLEEELKPVIRQAVEYYRIRTEREEYETKLEIQNKAYQKILKRVDEVIADSKHNAEMFGSIGTVAFERIMKSMEEENYRPEAAKKKIEISKEILQSLASVGLGEIVEKNVDEIINNIEDFLKNSREVVRFDIENRLKKELIAVTNAEILQALIKSTINILTRGIDNNIVKMTVQEEKDGDVSYCAITLLISNQAKVDIGFLKEEYERILDAAVEILNYTVGCAMRYLKGNYACSRIETHIVQKFII